LRLTGEDLDDSGSSLRGGDGCLKMGHARGGSAGGSGSYKDLSYPSPTTLWDSDIGDLRSSDGSATLHGPPPTEATAVYESIPHACTGKRGGECVL